LLGCSMAISSWKVYGTDRWALRCNPSSGNLHPTETYLALPEKEGFAAGLYHYRPQDHQLERRCTYPPALEHGLFNDLPAGSFLLGLSAIPWREAWKYGERAWRYCLLDLGHGYFAEAEPVILDLREAIASRRRAAEREAPRAQEGHFVIDLR